MTDSPVVTYESRDKIAIITIDNPAKRNALTRAVVDQLNAAWKRFQASDDRVAVLTASGDKALPSEPIWTTFPTIFTGPSPMWGSK